MSRIIVTEVITTICDVLWCATKGFCFGTGLMHLINLMMGVGCK
jgi:hypothetical protein